MDTIDDGTLETVLTFVHRYQVVLIEDQHSLNDDQHLELMLRIGKPYIPL